MTFTYGGKGVQKLTKAKTDESPNEEGIFAIDMSARYPGWSSAIGKLTTKDITVLSGRDTGDPRTDIYEYWIFRMTDDEMILGVVDSEWGAMYEGYEPDKEGWGQACRWVFKAK